MPKIVTTIIKNPSDPWILVSRDNIPSDIFDPVDRYDILLPYFDFIKNLPGIINAESEYVDDTTYKTTINFDTIENAENAYKLAFAPFPNKLDDKVILKNRLLRKKLQERFITYQVSSVVIP